MGKFTTCLECLSVEVDSTRADHDGHPVIGYECADCGNDEVRFWLPFTNNGGRFETFATMADTEIVAMRAEAN